MDFSQLPDKKVLMERDGSAQELQAELWCGEVKAGLFLTDDVSVVRNEWLQEGVVPRCSVSGVCKFTSVTRATPEGDCIVKRMCPYYYDIKEFMRSSTFRIGASLQGWRRCG